MCLFLNSILFDYNFHEFYYFRLMFNVSRAAANHLGLKDLLPETSLPDQLLHQLEILACDSLTLQHRPAEVALALLATNFQQRATREPGHSTALMGFISELQKYCNVSMIMMTKSGIFCVVWPFRLFFGSFWQQTLFFWQFIELSKGIIFAKGQLATIHYDSAPRPQRSCFAHPTVHTCP